MIQNRRRVLLCANPDLNLIDGSSVWLQTLALALEATGGAIVDLLARSKPQRPELYSVLQQLPHLSVIDGTSALPPGTQGCQRLSFEQMATMACSLDAIHSYDLVVVRGLDIARNFLRFPHLLSKAWIYLTDIPQDYMLCDAEMLSLLRRIAAGANRILCQSEGFVSLWWAVEPTLPPERVALYGPIIPDCVGQKASLQSRPVRAVYAGKFKPEWMTLEMALNWPLALARYPSAEFVVIGDKIHHDTTKPTFSASMKQALTTTPNLRWVGATPRASVLEMLRSARVGLSWRAESMNGTLEYSTKLLEYGSAGCAAIINRNDLHESLFGADYPLFANSVHQYVSKLNIALAGGEVAQEAADRMTQIALGHQFSGRLATLSKWLRDLPPATSKISVETPRKRILIAGHDLKFFIFLQRDLQKKYPEWDFAVDVWKGHNSHDEQQSRRLLSQADIVVCEWCLGNLAWYATHKSPSQKLVARYHAQEIRSPITRTLNWAPVECVVFVSEHKRREAGEAFPSLAQVRTVVIPNYFDEQRFPLRQKVPEAQHTLGIVGIAPMGKRLDRAVDLLELVLERDPRFCLRVKGRNPLDYPWINARPDEVAYYQGVLSRVNSSPTLRYRVIFDPAGEDVATWFRMVGFILSPSESESFHMSIGEGMLTGATPVIWNWCGAEELWPDQFVVSSSRDAVELVLQSQQPTAASNREYVLSKYSPARTASAWSDLLGLGRPPAVPTPDQSRH
jgi:glycosyltransferase involved in cell wall biosynthesis